ncbi:MAG: hypothetical protein H6739_37275 [Alphaproteobacteria bacterium]|nr:hypothetical protein [Alphaproteobacteria bacterium]
MTALLLLACAGPPAAPTVTLHPEGLTLRAEGGVDRATLTDPDGVPALTRRTPAPVDTLALDTLWTRGGAWTLDVRGPGGSWTLPLAVDADALGLGVEIERSDGAGRATVSPGETVPVVSIDGAPAAVAVHVVTATGGEAVVRVGDETTRLRLAPGRHRVAEAVVTASTPVSVQIGAKTRSFTLAPQTLTGEALAQRLSIAEVTFPADSAGVPDVARPNGRVTLPAAWWRDTLDGLGLGARARDPWAPWAWTGVTLENTGDEPLNVVVRLQVTDDAGAPAPAFRPQLREGDDGSGQLRVLLRVPPHDRATAALPLFVDEALLDAHAAAEGRWVRHVEVTPLGATRAVATDRAPLFVSRGSTVASLGLLTALVAAALGSALLAVRLPVWLRTTPTSALTTIALFGALSFVVGAAGQLLTMGLATVLGPFAGLLTGLIDDALRYALLATLLTLLPRPGTAALATLVRWLLSGVAMGTFSPTDLLFVGGRVLWLEGALWLAGVTRNPRWLDEPPALRWLRLSTGFGVASVLTSATGLVLHVTLYRLFLADWYVALMLAGPGFLYVVAACGMAVPFAESLRRIRR